MRICVTGKGTSGSWFMRGEQLGRAIGADLLPQVTLKQRFDPYDVAVVVKRVAPEALDAIRRAGKPIVWDVVDAWPQPTRPGSVPMSKDEAMSWLRNSINAIRPQAIVAATSRMAGDIHEIEPDIPVRVVYHHGTRYSQELPPIRDRITILGYTGAQHYIEPFMPALTDWCSRNGAWLSINGPYHKYDVVLALRGVGGWPARHWKSNVKLANAQANGIPCICSPENGYLETTTHGELFVNDLNEEDSLLQALDSLKSADVRNARRQRMLSRDVSLQTIAKEYKEWLTTMKF